MCGVKMLINKIVLLYYWLNRVCLKLLDWLIVGVKVKNIIGFFDVFVKFKYELKVYF